MQGDGTALTVSWNGRSDVSALAGRPVQMLFELQDARLFAFQFVRAEDFTGIRTPGAAVPEFAVRPAYPNPANPGVQFEYTLPQPNRVRSGLHNALAEKVRSLTPGLLGAGAHRATWDGTTAQGRLVSSGLYIYRLVAGRHVGRGC